MVNVSATALSGLFANEKRLAVAADNIANINTKDVAAREVQLSSNLAGGVTAEVVEKNPPTIPVASRDGGVEQRPNVSLEEELIGAKFATYGAQANLKVLQAQDKVNKYLLDIQA